MKRLVLLIYGSGFLFIICVGLASKGEVSRCWCFLLAMDSVISQIKMHSIMSIITLNDGAGGVFIVGLDFVICQIKMFLPIERFYFLFDYMLSKLQLMN